MKINNKGFTLVELLAVMLILISISLVAISTVTDSLIRRDEKECEEQQALAVSAAKLYFSLNGGTSVTIKKLNGEVSSSDEDYFKDDKKIDRLDKNATITLDITNNRYVYSGDCS